jgi:hypothetical protein
MDAAIDQNKGKGQTLAFFIAFTQKHVYATIVLLLITCGEGQRHNLNDRGDDLKGIDITSAVSPSV